MAYESRPVGGGAWGEFWVPDPVGGSTGGSTGSSTGGPGNLPGYVPSNYTAPYGGTPSVPDPRTTMTDVIAANMGALPNLYDLAGKINDFNYQQKLNQILKLDPNFQGQLGQSFKNIEAAQRGEVPQDVANVLRNKAASMGIGSGTAGSDFIDFNNLYNYGLTSLDQQRWSENALTGALGRLPNVTPFDFTGMMLSPDALQQARTMANIYASAPNPTAAAQNALAAAQVGMRGGYNTSRPTPAALPTVSVSPVGAPVSVPLAVQPYQSAPAPAPVSTTPGWGETWQISPEGGQMFYESVGNVPGGGNAPVNAPAPIYDPNIAPWYDPWSETPSSVIPTGSPTDLYNLPGGGSTYDPTFEDWLFNQSY